MAIQEHSLEYTLPFQIALSMLYTNIYIGMEDEGGGAMGSYEMTVACQTET